MKSFATAKGSPRRDHLSSFGEFVLVFLVRFGWLGFVPRKSCTTRTPRSESKGRQPPEQRRADIALAQRLAQEGGTLFEVAERYLPSRIADAVTHASQASRAGVVLIDFSQH
jgi:hypothetical protein